jgi:uncharacterized membrane protein YfcA
MIHLPVAQIEMSVPFLVGFGLGIGFLAGFFGVGGGFILTPLLIALGVPPNVAVGSGLTIMMGASVSGTVRHVQLGHVDFKLASILFGGAVIGVQAGARLLESLKGAHDLHVFGARIDAAHFYLSLCYMSLLFGIGIVMLLESGRSARTAPHLQSQMPLAKRMQSLPLPPHVAFAGSGVERYPLLLLLAMGVLVGALAGLLGVGGGTIMLPMMVYFIGLRAQRAVGTDLCQICVTAAAGAVSHAFRGNVDPVLAGIVLASSLAGARLGASTTAKVHGLRLRLYFGLFTIAVGLVVCYTFLRRVHLMP